MHSRSSGGQARKAGRDRVDFDLFQGCGTVCAALEHVIGAIQAQEHSLWRKLKAEDSGPGADSGGLATLNSVELRRTNTPKYQY